MALADTLGTYGTSLNLPAGESTTTIESKSNFFFFTGQTICADGGTVFS